MNNKKILFERLIAKHEPPYALLLLADPSKEMIDAYWAEAEVYVAKQEYETIGVVVLQAISHTLLEIKNLAVTPSWQGKGVGSGLIAEAIEHAKAQQYEQICIGTANSSRQQLALYQKIGFQVTEVRKDFFITHYPDPIFEDGMQAVDMIMLSMKLGTAKAASR